MDRKIIETSPVPLRRRTLGQLLDAPYTPREPLLGDWLVERHLNLTWAPTGVGKTLFAASVALAVAGGGSVFGWDAKEPRRVLYVDGEMDLADLQERSRLLTGAVSGLDLEATKSNLTFIARHDQDPDVIFPDLGEEAGQDLLVHIAEELRPALVILDNLSTLATLEDENAAEAFNPIIKLVNRLKSHGSAVMVIHHANKGGKALRGSSKISAVFESIIALKDAREGGFGNAAFEIGWEKLRQSPELTGKPVRAVLRDGLWEFSEALNPTLTQFCQLARSGDYASQTAIGEAMGLSRQRVSEIKNEAIKAALITADELRRCFTAAKDLKEAEDALEAYQF